MHMNYHHFLVLSIDLRASFTRPDFLEIRTNFPICILHRTAFRTHFETTKRSYRFLFFFFIFRYFILIQNWLEFYFQMPFHSLWWCCFSNPAAFLQRYLFCHNFSYNRHQNVLQLDATYTMHKKTIYRVRYRSLVHTITHDNDDETHRPTDLYFVVIYFFFFAYWLEQFFSYSTIFGVPFASRCFKHRDHCWSH